MKKKSATDHEQISNESNDDSRRLRDLIEQWRSLKNIRSTSRLWQDFDRDQKGADAEGWRPLDPGERAIFVFCANALEIVLAELSQQHRRAT